MGAYESRQLIRAFQSIASGLRRDRLFIVVGDALCSDGEIEVLVKGAECRDFGEDVKEHYAALKNVVEELNIECVATVCVNGLLKEFIDGVIELFGSCRGEIRRVVSKHVADEYLKCLSICDTVVFLGIETPMRFVANTIPLGLALGKRVVLLSNRITELDGIHPLYERVSY